jgi:hypothetical protein
VGADRQVLHLLAHGHLGGGRQRHLEVRIQRWGEIRRGGWFSNPGTTSS